MCRSITILHGLDPAATASEIHDASLQYVRKISGQRIPAERNREVFDVAVERVAAATAELLAGLAPRRNPPPTVPPLRRRAVVVPTRGAQTVPAAAGTAG